MTHVYQITGMTCLSCVGRVKSNLLKLGDVQEAKVQLESPQLVLTMHRHIPTPVLQKTIENAGDFRIIETMEDNGEVLQLREEPATPPSYFPIFLIFGYLSGFTLLLQAINGSFELLPWMSQFMAGFFLVFSFFKLMNLKGFAEGYQTYDIIAKKLPAWGFIYPFVELGLAIAFITGFSPLGTNIATLLVMSISSIGVIESLVNKRMIQCACLGTVIRLPLSKVTLFEDGLMVAMSAAMIFLMG